MVARFSTSPPNPVLMQFAASELQRGTGNRLLDIGCGAGCNAVPLARMGWKVLGVDLSQPMLKAAANRAREANLTQTLRVEAAPMDRLATEDQGYDFIVAHGIWNLAGSAVEFRAALREAARVARPGAALFIYTFSRNTLSATAEAVPGEPFVFTDFSGNPQCFLTRQQLIHELRAAGFEQDPEHPITEYDQPESGAKPAIYEGIFRRVSSTGCVGY